MEPADAGTVGVVVVIVGVVAVAGARRIDRGRLRLVHHFHIRGDDRFRAARIVGQRAEQVAVFIGLVNNGISLDSGVFGDRLCGRRLHCCDLFFARR
jgi:hypothetical protein